MEPETFILSPVSSESPAKASKTWLDMFDPGARVVCALSMAAFISSIRSPAGLMAATPVPLALLVCGDVKPLFRMLLRLNLVSLVMTLLFGLTYPGESLGPFTREGLAMGLLTAVRLNLISIVLWRMVAAMGIKKIDAALARLGLSEKLRVLLLLTLRGIFILYGRAAASLRAVHLRAPGLSGLLKYRTFAGLAASSLVRSSDRSERMLRAMQCRGGLAGFAQVPSLKWRRRDTLFCLCFVLNFLLYVFIFYFYFMERA